MSSFAAIQSSVEIPVDGVLLPGQLDLPPRSQGLVVLARGAGSHHSQQERVAGFLHDADLGTLRVDLLAADAGFNGRLRDAGWLARRLRQVTQWCRLQPETAEQLIGYFGAGSSAGAVLAAAAAEGLSISAVVTRGGRFDHAIDFVPRLRSPTLLIVGGNDRRAVAANLEVWARLTCEKSVEIIPGAGPRFDEPGAVDNVAALAARWLGEHLKKDLGF